MFKNILKPRPVAPGGLIGSKKGDGNSAIPHSATVSLLKTQNNRLFLLAAGGIVGTIICGMGWQQANKRFEENVRVSYVKMSPNGNTNIEYADEDKPIDFFPATVESKLAEYVEKRFSKRKETIATDYGFARLMMEEDLRKDFMENQKAAEIAAAIEECKDCKRILTKVREQQGIDKDPVPHTRKQQQYTTLLFITQQTRSAQNAIEGCSNKIVTLLWTFRPMKEVVKRNDELRYNPLGQGVIRESIRDDPTPISDAECKKLQF